MKIDPFEQCCKEEQDDLINVLLNKPCEHKYVFIDSSWQKGERPSWGISGEKQWKRVDHFFCEKCLIMNDVTRTAEGWENRPDWF
jgi:hypothetical protein